MDGESTYGKALTSFSQLLPATRPAARLDTNRSTQTALNIVAVKRRSDDTRSNGAKNPYDPTHLSV